MELDKKSFGARLRELRLASGLSQEALAERCGVGQGRISQWESGTNAPLITQTVKLAEALGVGIEELVKPPSPPPKRSTGKKR